MKCTGFFLLFLFLSLQLAAQSLKKITINQSANGQRLGTYLAELEKNRNIDFIYSEELVKSLRINGVLKSIYLEEYLEGLLQTTGHTIVKARNNVFFIVPEKLRWEYGKNNENYMIFELKEGKQQLIKGRVLDSSSEKPIVGAQVVIPATGAGVLTDINGNFELKVPENIYQLEVRFVGFETGDFLVGFSSAHADREQKAIRLNPASIELEGVTVTAERGDRNVQAVIPGVEKLGIELIKELPTFLGEVDPVKSLTTLPGVSTVGELASGINVRGGETGQNLILQDGAVIYNPTHLFGFFSAFNPDIVSEVSLFKGGGPANFGGRISSVLDVKLRNGDGNRHSVKGGVGLISSRLSLEGPIIKNKASYLIGGRGSYTDWLLKATNNLQLVNSTANFYDGTARLFFQLNDNNVLSFSGYNSYDDFSLASDSTISWGTTNLSLKWDHTFTDELFSALSLSSSNYFSAIHSAGEIEGFEYRNSINNIWLKNDFFYKRNEALQLTFGWEANGTKLEPGQLDPLGEITNVLPVDLTGQHVLETAAYLQADYDVTDKLGLSAGLRFSHFFRLGEGVIYTYDYKNLDGRYPSTVDTLNYERGELMANYGGFEPRISARYLLSPSTSVKGSYYRTYQYLHLISNTTTATPQDYWVASGPALKPEIGDQVSLGVFQNLGDDAYEFSVEGYYKTITNAVDYIEGADISLNENLEAGLVRGNGLSYGLEFLARKNAGTLNGWVSYTYSRSLRQFKSDGKLRSINEGRYYAAPFDQPHNLSVILNYKLGPKSTFSTNFSFSTGRPITIPVSKFSYDAYLAVLNYSERNEYRIPDYHRLDISLTLKGKERKNVRYRDEWVLSVFNVYNRKNAYSVFFSRYGSAKKLSILGSVFPSVSYNFKF